MGGSVAHPQSQNRSMLSASQLMIQQQRAHLLHQQQLHQQQLLQQQLQQQQIQQQQLQHMQVQGVGIPMQHALAYQSQTQGGPSTN
jgi:transcriptional adapter 2-alpha